MGAWNEWMHEREEAPLDRLLSHLRHKWQETKEWLEEACTDDDNSTADPTCKKVSTNSAQSDPPGMQPSRDPQTVCLSGYEELDQDGSQPASRPQTYDHLASTIPQMRSSIPLPAHSTGMSVGPKDFGKSGNETAQPSNTEPMAPSESVSEHKMMPSENPQRNCSGPSPAAMEQDGQSRQLAQQKAVVVESWNPSKRAWVGETQPAKRALVDETQPCGPPELVLGEDGQPMFQVEEMVEVWSNSQKAWCDGVVVESFAIEGEADGCKIPAGAYKVRYSENIFKWIWPDHAQDLLRPSSTTSGL